MKKDKDEKWLDMIISKATDLGKVEFEAQKWNEKYLSNESHEASCANVKIKSDKNIWRFIMESKVTKYSAAAVVTLAAVLVLLNPFGTSKNGGIVWAKVIENMDKVQIFAHKEHRFYYELGKDEPFLKTDVQKYICPKYGIVEEQYTTDYASDLHFGRAAGVDGCLA